MHPAKRREKDSAMYRFINQKLQRRNVRKDVRKKGVVRRERERKKERITGAPPPLNASYFSNLIPFESTA